MKFPKYTRECSDASMKQVYMGIVVTPGQLEWQISIQVKKKKTTFPTPLSQNCNGQTYHFFGPLGRMYQTSEIYFSLIKYS